MGNGLHLYSGFTDPMATKHFTYSLTFTHSLKHRRRCQPSMQGIIQLTVTVTGAACSWTPRRLVRWNRGLNHKPS